MKYVLDASVALKWVLPEANSDKALALRDAFDRQVDELIAPHFFLWSADTAYFARKTES